MSARNSPHPRINLRPNPRPRGTTPDPSFITEFSRMLIDKETQHQANLKQGAEEKARIHQAALEEADTIHDQVREHALQTLDAYLQIRAQEREEASRQLRARHEEESRALQLKATNKRLEDERRKAEQEKEIQDKLNEANALAEKTQAAEKARLSTPARLASTPQQQPPPPIQHQVPVQIVQPPPVQQPPAAKSPPSNLFQSTPEPQAVQPLPPAMAPVTYQASPIAKSIPQKDAIQKQYLDLHKSLKVVRKDLKNAGAGARAWTDKRRDFKKALGQLSSDTAESLTAAEKDRVRKGNSEKRSKMLGILQQAMTAPGPTVDARNYLITVKAKFANIAPDQAQVPAVFICLINYFAKISIKMLRESTLQTMTNLVGISVAFIFGHMTIRWNGESFIDIFLAKYHKACPVLFGIYGREDTTAGRNRIGWGKEGEQWIDTAIHQEEMMGLAMGWSAVTLRDFKTSKTAQNALPAYHFWASVANIVNVPAKDVQETHLIVLKNILEHYADKFVRFYGQAAMVAMRRAVVEFPAPLKESTARSGLVLLREIFARKFGIRL